MMAKQIEQISQPARCGISRVGYELRPDLGRLLRRKVVNANMKVARTKRDRPFKRDRNIKFRVEHFEMRASADVVVIGYRHDCLEPERALDLLDFALEHGPGRKRRNPIGPREINNLAIPRCIQTKFSIEELRDQRNLRGIVRNKVEGLFRLICVAVKRYRGCETLYCFLTRLE